MGDAGRQFANSRLPAAFKEIAAWLKEPNYDDPDWDPNTAIIPFKKIASNVLFSSNEPNQTEFITIQFEDDDDRVKQFHHWLGVRESWKINLAKTKKLANGTSGLMKFFKKLKIPI